MTPEQLKQPVNGYQMLQFYERLGGIEKAIQSVADNTNGVVLAPQLAKAEADIKRYVDKEIKDSVEKVDLTYGPMKQNITKFTWIMVTAVIGQVVTLGGLVLLAFSRL